jgi:hypothetical protein
MIESKPPNRVILNHYESLREAALGYGNQVILPIGTPGPWHQHDPDYCPLEIFGNLEGPLENGQIRGTLVCLAENETDARLIASAPELWEALNNLLKVHKNVLKPYLDSGFLPGDEIRKAENALRKGNT